MSGSDFLVEFLNVIRVRCVYTSLDPRLFPRKKGSLGSRLRLYHLFIKRRLKIIQVAVWRYI